MFRVRIVVGFGGWYRVGIWRKGFRVEGFGACDVTPQSRFLFGSCNPVPE